MSNIEKLRDLIVYQSENNNVMIEVLYDEENFWLTQKTMAELFNVKVNTINYHLKEIFNSGELNEKATIRKIRQVQKEGNRQVERELDFYSFRWNEIKHFQFPDEYEELENPWKIS